MVPDPVWYQVGLQTGITPLTRLHPYVQTPLWAYSLQPLCRSMNFSSFNWFFTALLALCSAALVWITARWWCPRLFHPLWIAVICVATQISEPMRYAEFLTQTHMIFILLTVAALMLAGRDRPVWAGLLLALAAAVKITPAFLLIYWLTSRRWKAAASFISFSLILLLLGLLVTGPQIFAAFLHELKWFSNILLVAFNNQSLAAWWMSTRVDPKEISAWHIMHLPRGVKLVSLLLLIFSTCVGGLLDLRNRKRRPDLPPYGGVFALVGATMFTPLAWTHYYILLIVPLMLLLDAWLARRFSMLLITAAAAYALNVYPLAARVATDGRVSRITLFRSQFYSGWVVLAGLVLLAFLREKYREKSLHYRNESLSAALN
jgi:uncharacterized membrane protein